MRTRLACLPWVFLLAACSSSGPQGGAPIAASTSSGGGGGGGEAALPPVVASFVPEGEVGEGPAKLRLFNDSDQILSLTLPDGQAFAFYLVEPFTTTEFIGAAVADMVEQIIVSLHTKDTCVRFHFDSIDGVAALEPGHAYTLHVKVSPESGAWAEVIEEPAPLPFTGLRALVFDPAPSQKPLPSRFVLDVDLPSPGAELLFEGIFDGSALPYQLVEGGGIRIGTITLEDRQGGLHTSAEAVDLAATGYTVVVGPDVEPGAESTVELHTP